MACAAAAVHKKKPQSRLLALLALSWACLQTAQPVRALAGPVRAALFDPRTPAFWLSRCSSRPSTSSSISTGPHRQLRPLRVSPRRAVQASEPSESEDDKDKIVASARDEQLQKTAQEKEDKGFDEPTEQDTLSQKLLEMAVKTWDGAQKDLDGAREDLDGAREDRDFARQRFREAVQNGDEKERKEAREEFEKAKEEAKRAESKVQAAKEEATKAREELEKAKSTAPLQVDVSQAAEFFGKLLFDDTAGWPLTDAGYQSSRSCIVDLGRGPFSGALASGKQEKSNLLDRDTEMQYVVEKVAVRAAYLKGCVNSDKTASPALLVAQAPGSGKSHFLAELGEKIPSLPDLEGQEQKPIVSAFTYNSAMGNKLTQGSFTSSSAVDLALRVLYGAAHHMTRARLRCTSWMGFLDAINAAASSNNMLASLVNLDFAVKILRHLYGARPLVILADEVGRSDDEGLVRNRLCQLMDSWAGQVYVVMSALSDYEGVVDMFNESKRKVELQILPVLGVDTFDKFQSVLTDLDRGSGSNTKKAILRYRIGLAWGATAGYARAVEYLTAHLRNSNGLSGGSVSGAIAEIGEMGTNLPPRFKAEELEALLQSWESVDCPFQQLSQVIGIMSLRPGMYRGSVLVEPRRFETPQQQTKYLPTVAAWHAASWFETSLHLVQSYPRSQKLWHMMGKAYRTKRVAIESSNETIVKQAAAYFTEVTGALGAMLAIVKGHEKLPQALKTSCGSFLDIGFNDSLAQDPALATADKDEAQQKLESFLREARELGINHCGTSPFLVIMAPANCMALDFVIFRRENGSLVAVQVKSNTLLNQKDVEEQSKKLHKAAETVRQRNVEFLAVLGSNFPKGFIDDLFSLQQEDLVALIPPFLRHLSGLAAGVPGPDSAE